MSFGWSAGGIAGAITLILNLAEALDSRNGSAGDYREAVAFLQDLKRVLGSLRTLSAWNSYPAYGKDIREQVEQIRGPIEIFLDEIRKYEPSLGSKASEGRHRQFVGKLQWHLFTSKKVLSLRKKIESNMRIIDSIIQHLKL
jgi:hypothetical protein